MEAISQRNNRADKHAGRVSGRRRCSCCPYGYHIDLDFVRFCESITNSQLMPESSAVRVNNIRRKRASRKALLGLLDYPNLKQERSHPKVSQDVGDDLQKAVIDFEKTLLNTSLPRNTHIVHTTAFQNYENPHFNGGSLDRYNLKHNKLSMISTSHDRLNGTEPKIKPKNDIENVHNNEANNASAEILQAIRKQMASSLCRMKELEEEIKLIPGLKEQIVNLQKENFSLKDLINSKDKKNKLSVSDAATSTLDFCHTRTLGVGCTVLTRDVGVLMSPIPTKSVGTDPHHKVEKSINSTDLVQEKPISLNNIIGIPPSFKFRNAETLTELLMSDVFTETDVKERSNLKRSVTKLKIKNAETLTDMLINDVYTYMDVEERVKMTLDKIKVNNKNAQTSTPITEFKNAQTSTSSNLKTTQTSTTLNQFQIFTQEDIEEEVNKRIKLNEKNVLNKALTKKLMMANVGVQTVNHVNVPNKTDIGIQFSPKSQEIGIVAKPRVYDRLTQSGFQTRDIGVSDDIVTEKDCKKCNVKRFSASTNFPELGIFGIDISTDPLKLNEILKKKSESVDTDTEDLIISRGVGVNTMKMKYVSTGIDTCNFPCQTCSKQENKIKPVIQTLPKRPSYLPVRIQSHQTSKPSSPSPSRTPSTPLRNDESNSDSGSDDGTYTVLQESSVSSSKLESLLTQEAPKPRDYKKKEPSKEMRGALKVLNDALQKSPSGDFPKHMKTAINIVQQEWFKVSSVAASNPLHIEDYLDCFEEISSTLLEYIVNMTDVTGNTAMHYAVSNGNFDVVSILLDSKVCNINKLNTAGYTCIMLVALTKVKSETDREVVRRLFHMADVNIRAKEHGQTALMLAVSHGRVDTAEMLLEAGADINIQDEDGSTALMCAAEHGCIDIVKLLLAHPDCDLSVTDYDGSTALAIAMNAGNRNVGVLLYAQEHFSRGSSPYTSLKSKRSKSTTPTLKASRPSTPSHSSHRKDFDSMEPS